MVTANAANVLKAGGSQSLNFSSYFSSLCFHGNE